MERIKPLKSVPVHKFEAAKSKNFGNMKARPKPHGDVCTINQLGEEIGTVNKVNLNGQFYDSLFDTGSDNNLIRSSIVVNNTWSTSPCNKRLRGFDGTIHSVEKMLHARVCHEDTQAEMDFELVENLPYDVIIGRNGLKQLGLGLKKLKNNTTNYEN